MGRCAGRLGLPGLRREQGRLRTDSGLSRPQPARPHPAFIASLFTKDYGDRAVDPIIIVGTGLAGYNLAKEYRKLNQERPLILLTADDGRNYSKPMLSTGFTKQKSADELALADAATMAQQLKADVKTFVQVTAIDTAARTLTLSDNEQLTYGELVLAWGADVFRPPLAGDGVEQVYSVNDQIGRASCRERV